MTIANANILATDTAKFALFWDALKQNAAVGPAFTAFADAMDFGSTIEDLAKPLMATKYEVKVLDKFGKDAGRIIYEGSGFLTNHWDNDAATETDNVFSGTAKITKIRMLDAEGRELLVYQGAISGLQLAGSASFNWTQLQVGSQALGAMVVLKGNLTASISNGNSMTLSGGVTELSMFVRNGLDGYQFSIGGSFNPNGTFIQDAMGNVQAVTKSLTGQIDTLSMQYLTYADATTTTAKTTSSVITVKDLKLPVAQLEGLLAGAKAGLDDSFGRDGVVLTAFGNGDDIGRAIVVQADGKIVVGGTAGNEQGGAFVVARYNADGSPDATFAGDGSAIANLAGSVVALAQKDGKTVAVGMSGASVALVRYNANGSLDSGFGNGGTVVSAPPAGGGADISDVLIQADGKIVVAGGFGTDAMSGSFALMRYTATGALDTGFSGDGIVTESFGGTNSFAASIALQADGRIVAAGVSDGRMVLARFLASGALDTSFGTGGKVVSPAYGDVTEVAVQPDGKVLVAAYGGSGAAGIARFNADGSADATFGSQGYEWVPGIYEPAIVLQPDGTILMAGDWIEQVNDGVFSVHARVNFARLSAGGVLLDSWQEPGLTQGLPNAYYWNSFAVGIALQSDGRVVVVGTASNQTTGNREVVVARFGNPDLVLRQAFLAGNDVFNLSAANAGGVPEDVHVEGGLGADTLTTGAGNDRLDGGAGADAMAGGAGNDTYCVDNGFDKTTEVGDSGVDVVEASINWKLGTNIEELVLQGRGNVDGTGNGMDNRLNGNGGNNLLDGGVGNDTMIGGGGDDTYVVADPGDQAVEMADQGRDTVRFGLAVGSYTLGPSLENAVITSNLAVDLAGNELDNSLVGNVAANSLVGGGGGDLLDGGAGGDILVGGDGNDTYIVDSLRDVIEESGSHWLEEVVRVSTSREGAEANSDSAEPQVSADGSLVLFTSRADNLVPDDTNGCADVFVKNMATREIRRVSGAADGSEGNGYSYRAEFSADGRRVVFISRASNLVSGDTNSAADIFVKDLETNVVTRVSTNSDGGQVWGALNCDRPRFSPDGRKVVFFSESANLVPGDSNGKMDIFVKDLDTGIVTFVATSESSGNYVEVRDRYADFSPDGTKVVFESKATDLIPGVVALFTQIYIKDLLTGTTTLVSTAQGGSQGNRGSCNAHFSPDGTKVLFESDATNLVANDTNGITDVFLKDLTTGLVSRVSIAADGSQASDQLAGVGSGSFNASFTADGESILFQSTARNLVQHDNIMFDGLFIKHLATGSVTGVPIEINGSDEVANARYPDLSADGASIVFWGGSDGLVADDMNGYNDIFMYRSGQGADTDTIRTTLNYDLARTANVENLTLIGTATIGTGNVLDNVITGNDLANTLEGKGGNDTLIGGKGNDTYIVADSDQIIDTSTLATEIDLVKASISFTLGANIENLLLTGTAAASGTGNGLANEITGNDGENTLDGRGGADKLKGGKGNDTYVVDDAKDAITENAGEGTDLVQASASWSLGPNLEDLTLTGDGAINGTGNGSNNTIEGNDGANLLDGGKGADALSGGTGDDTYLLDLVKNATGNGVAIGQDTVSEQADAGLDVLRFRTAGDLGLPLTLSVDSFGSNLEGIDASLTTTNKFHLTGNGRDNVLVGNAAANTLTGGAGNDRLIGGAGNDTLVGGMGDDTYGVDSALDQPDETGGDGIDWVEASIAFNLTGDLENLSLTGTAAINGTGNGKDNILVGNGGANKLDGLAGNDWMRGGGGNDTYVVDCAGDMVEEEVAGTAGGKDLVQSDVAYELGANLEHLELKGSAAIDAIGNELDNSLTGNGADNRLDGRGGKDVLKGGLGDDTYVAYLTRNGTTLGLDDTVTENVGEGSDTLEIRADNTALAGATYKVILANNLEKLVLRDLEPVVDDLALGPLLLDASGNAVNNIMDGNSAANRLEGLEGNDTLRGWGGNDFLDGGKGADDLTGGSGDDLYLVDDPGDQVTEGDEDGLDTVRIAILGGGIYTLRPGVENGLLINTAEFGLVGNNLDNVLTGNGAANSLDGGDGNDSLDGAGGADCMLGGYGDDTYVVDNAADVLVEPAFDEWDPLAGGFDQVRSAVSYTLGDGFDSLTLTGSSAINGTGNALGNWLIGNGGANMLIGGGGSDFLNGEGGADRLVGGPGDDMYWVYDSGDVVVELSDEGFDQVNASVSFSLAGGQVEQLTLVDLPGGNAINGSGNSLNNVILGNGSANVLDGGDGSDQLTGGGGNDILRGGAGDDQLAGGVGSDNLLGGGGADYYRASLGDVVNELGGDGIDVLALSLAQDQVAGLSDAIRQGLDGFSADLKFSKVNASRDLKIDFALDGGASIGSVTVVGMDKVATMVETLRLFNSNGGAIGSAIDLTSVWAAATTTPSGMRATTPAAYGLAVALS